MNDNWVVVQVGPVVQVPHQARFQRKQGWWYVYQRSRVADISRGHNVWRESKVDPWSATKYQDKNAATAFMHQHAMELDMPWLVFRPSAGATTIAYFSSMVEAANWKPFNTDVVMRTGWGKGDDDAT